jgi:hypothetical protein
MTPSRLLAGLGFVVVLTVAGAAQQEKPGATRPPADSSRTSAKGNAEHGRYIVEHIAMCHECHSPRDESGEIVRDQRFMGAPIPFRPPWPNDWAQRAPRNAGLPGYTDEQAIRLLTEGAIARDGRQLRLPMPRFRMTVDDARDVVAFMRSLH